MASLRTISSRRLIAGIGGVVVLVGVGVGVGSAVTGANPPAPQPLADALHQAATGAKPTGITADVTFTNNLLGSAGLTGTDPLMSGASGRLWMDANGDLRIELQTTGGGIDSQIVVNDTSITVFDGTQNTVYKIALPAKTSTGKATQHTGSIPTVEQIQSRLDTLSTHLNISGAIPGTAGAVPSYSVKISPQHDGGLLGDVQLAWDASNGVPLGISIYSTQDPSTPVLGLTVNDISYGAVDPGDVTITPPASAKVVNVPLPAKQSPTTGTTKHAPVTGLAAVQAQVSFPIAAPASVDALPLQQVRLVDWKGAKGALVTYGKGLGGIAVLEPPAGTADRDRSTPGGRSFRRYRSTGPGARVDNPVGNGVTFSQGGVDYVVAGSVSQIAAEAAAGELS